MALLFHHPMAELTVFYAIVSIQFLGVVVADCHCFVSLSHKQRDYPERLGVVLPRMMDGLPIFRVGQAMASGSVFVAHGSGHRFSGLSEQEL
jgi:hypothetical protein